jgi:NTE family protein
MNMAHSQEHGAGLIDGPALALSGGGYRAMLFHLGALWRLNELGWLGRLKRIDGVSGGAIAAAYLGLRWRELEFDAGGVAQNFAAVIAGPLCALCSRVLDIPVGLSALAWPISALPLALSRSLFGQSRLGDLPDGTAGPRVCALATNLLTGGLVELSARGIRDPFLGECSVPGLPLAMAVAASCSIPPSFRPVTIQLDPRAWRGECTAAYARTRSRRAALRLVDGGNSDNQALSYIRMQYTQVLVSDGSAPMAPWGWISGDWLTATLRSNRVLIDHIRDLQRALLRHGQLGGGPAQHTAYWAIAGNVDDHDTAGALPCDPVLTQRLALMRTRMGRYTPKEQAQLLNWGYSACDAALRGSLDPGAAPPVAWPRPEYGLAP